MSYNAESFQRDTFVSRETSLHLSDVFLGDVFHVKQINLVNTKLKI